MIEKLKNINSSWSIPETFFYRTREVEDKTAIMYKRDGSWQKITYAGLASRIIDLGSGLMELGIRRGDKVAILSENRLEYYIAELAVLACGGAIVSLYLNSTPSQINYILKDSGSRFLLISPEDTATKKINSIMGELYEGIKLISLGGKSDQHQDIDTLSQKGRSQPGLREEFFRRLKEVSSGDLAAIVYTSGASGDPKGVMLTHSNILSNVYGALSVLHIETQSVNISLLPLSHALEKTCSFYIFLFQGCTIAICDNLNNLPSTLKEIRPTHIIGVPKLFEAMHEQIIKGINRKSAIKRKLCDIGLSSALEVVKSRSAKKKAPISKRIISKTADGIIFKRIRDALGGRLKLLLSGGAPLPIPVAEFFNAISIPIIEGYGLTEAAPVVSVNTLAKSKLGTVGIPIKGVEVRTSEEGEILVKGPNIMKGYWGNDEATREAIDRDGWLHTGDLGNIDDEGFLTITGRKKDIIVTPGGKKISPQNIEARLLSHPFIKQAVVLGEGRDFLSALIVPDQDRIRPFIMESVDGPGLDAIIDAKIKEINEELSNFEKIKKFRILKDEFSIETGELTPTYKLRRSFIAEKYSDLLKDIYGD